MSNICTNKDFPCKHRNNMHDCIGNTSCSFMSEELTDALIDDEYKDGTHASYYGGEDDTYEAIKVINAWAKNNEWTGMQGFIYGMVLKYIARAGKKKGNSEAQDIQKCINYLQMRLNLLQ